MKGLTAKEVMTRNVRVVGADWPIEHLAQFLIDTGISGAPVVSENGSLVGVVSLTDIVRHDSLPEKEPSRRGAHEYYISHLEGQYAAEELGGFTIRDGSMVTVRDIMTPMIFSVGPDTLLKEVADTMITGRIHRVFVTEGQQVVGMVSALDMLQVIRDHG